MPTYIISGGSAGRDRSGPPGGLRNMMITASNEAEAREQAAQRFAAEGISLHPSQLDVQPYDNAYWDEAQA